MMMRECKQQKKREEGWENLPLELLSLIGDHIDFPFNYHSVRSVCRKWHSFFPPLPFLLDLNEELPYQIQPRSTLFKETGRHIFLVLCVIHVLEQRSQPINDSKPWFFSSEELHPGKLRFLLPLRRNYLGDHVVTQNIPKTLDLSNFKVSFKSRALKLCYDDGDEDVFDHISSPRCWESYPTKSKVLCSPGMDGICIEDRVLVVLLISKGGYLGFLDLDTGSWNPFKKCTLFDDIVSFGNDICAVNRKGCAFLFSGPSSPVRELVTDPIGKGSGRESRKRLVESDGTLYMICQLYGRFRVYELNEGERKWDEVNSFGDRILFVTFDHCFFVDGQDFPGCKGNCIVYPKDCFPLYSGGPSFDHKLFIGASKYLELGVFYLGDTRSCLISSYPHLSQLLWPPPSWITPDTDFSRREVFQPKSSSDSTDSEFSQAAEKSTSFLQAPEDVRHTQEEVAQVPREDENDGLIPAANALLKIAKSASQLEKCHTLHDQLPQKQDQLIIDVEMVPDSTSCDKVPKKPDQVFIDVDLVQDETSLDKNDENHVSGEKFQGLNVSSHLVPILQKIWDRHGNLIPEHGVHSSVLLTWALETIAKVIAILQSDSAGFLSDSQAEYLNSSLHDLQLMHFKVDWLAPFVRSTLAHHKSKERGRIIT